jgi:cytochrome b
MHQPETIKIWDPLVRIFHWGLAVTFLLAYFTEDDYLAVHTLAGYTLLGLLGLRLLWGLVGSRYARFSDFVKSPSTTLAYLKDILTTHPKRYLGHNPAGGAMVVALLVSAALTGLSGVAVYGAQELAGPLAEVLRGTPPAATEALEELHEVLANFSLFLVILHLAGVALASLQHHENLVRAMITGYKRREVR